MPLPLWGDEPVAEPTITSSATVSPCGQYRYILSRRWATGVPAIFVMLNPSTADATVNDPTIVRCIRYARDWGMAALVVVNLYAYRATDPRALWVTDDPVGPDNDAWLRREFAVADAIGAPLVAAWGVNARPARVAHVMTLPGADRFRCLGYAKDGAPRHPLYMPADALLIPWRPA